MPTSRKKKYILLVRPADGCFVVDLFLLLLLFWHCNIMAV